MKTVGQHGIKEKVNVPCHYPHIKYMHKTDLEDDREKDSWLLLGWWHYRYYFLLLLKKNKGNSTDFGFRSKINSGIAHLMYLLATLETSLGLTFPHQ